MMKKSIILVASIFFSATLSAAYVPSAKLSLAGTSCLTEGHSFSTITVGLGAYPLAFRVGRWFISPLEAEGDYLPESTVTHSKRIPMRIKLAIGSRMGFHLSDTILLQASLKGGYEAYPDISAGAVFLRLETGPEWRFHPRFSCLVESCLDLGRNKGDFGLRLGFKVYGGRS